MMAFSGGSRIFPRRGRQLSGGEGALTYDFAKFPQKLHEIERIWTPEGGRGASKILLCRSATGFAIDTKFLLERFLKWLCRHLTQCQPKGLDVGISLHVGQRKLEHSQKYTNLTTHQDFSQQKPRRMFKTVLGNKWHVT